LFYGKFLNWKKKTFWLQERKRKNLEEGKKKSKSQKTKNKNKKGAIFLLV
jgi:hypothetical protein